ncbi:hypothetical protein BGP89_13915 [Luteimonas sp. JM171]|uniref:hypothetical protein n=1 Tax=Luteimonas sp. JM171 TaxID=1896164 RepID=UPI000B21A433|nr:hypothetical protein [Luteimonas sp. JM171]
MSEPRGPLATAIRALGRAVMQKTPEAPGPGAAASVQYEGEASELLYSRGFILCRPERAPASVASWNRWRVGDWELRVDPRVPLDHAAAGGREVWIVGDAFHSRASVFTDVARWAMGVDSLDLLEGLAGRFLLISRTGSKVELFHDAMGSRSVFYANGVVASHSALVAEVTGAGLQPWVLPFITSRGYIKRDVKYLPGLDSPFSGVAQLTPNTSLDIGAAQVRRYWPRSSIREATREQALDALLEQLRGLRQYFIAKELRPIIGLSAGRDSRGVLAALHDLQPRIFTFVRSSSDRAGNPADTRAARELADVLGLELEVIRLHSPPPLDGASTAFSVAFRHNTGYVRGNGSGWVEHYVGGSYQNELFVRGFGGEVMRGFYPKTAEANPKSLSNLYDVNAGSNMTREAFERFMRISNWSRIVGTGYQPQEALYWEHRMGVWGASALSESDMAFRGIPGYNGRDLFSSFMGLPSSIDRRSIFEAAVSALAPELGAIAYDR